MKRQRRFFATFTVLLLFSFPAFALQAADVNSFKLNTAKGIVPFSSLKGQAIYLDFWASWCAPCRKSFPWLNEMQDRYARDGFRVIAVNLDKDEELARKFLRENPVNFLIAYDPAGELASDIKVKGMPSSFLIDRNGKIVSSHIGFREKEVKQMEQKIRELISK